MAGYWFSPQPLSYFTYLKRIFWRPNGFCGVADRSSKYLDEAYEEMVNIIEYNKELQAKVNILRRQLAELETEDGMQESPWIPDSLQPLEDRQDWYPISLSLALQFTFTQ